MQRGTLSFRDSGKESTRKLQNPDHRERLRSGSSSPTSAFPSRSGEARPRRGTSPARHVADQVPAPTPHQWRPQFSLAARLRVEVCGVRIKVLWKGKCVNCCDYNRPSQRGRRHMNTHDSRPRTCTKVCPRDTQGDRTLPTVATETQDHGDRCEGGEGRVPCTPKTRTLYRCLVLRSRAANP